ncbi:hypothetical protein [Hoeflea sp.]|uniref:hypothetical protein n=1 Tax=Hoeflea sp. TaxID=1940281 RepID=UPI003B020B24
MRPNFLPVAAYAVCLCVCVAGAAQAGPKYDRKIEQAAITIVAGKLGMIRGTHDIAEPHSIYPPIEVRSASDGTLLPARRYDVGIHTADIDALLERR